MKNTKEALNWIVTILRKHQVPYRITGGLAVRAYGSERPLADIDIEIPDKYFPAIVPAMKEYLFFGPAKYKDKNFDTYGIGATYKGQNIEISGATSEKLFDAREKKWVKSRINISHVSRKRVYGLIVNVIDKKDLIDYKKRLSRRVDKKDLKVLEKKKEDL